MCRATHQKLVESHDEAAVGVVCRLEHSEKEIVIKWGISYLPGTQSERDSVMCSNEAQC